MKNRVIAFIICFITVVSCNAQKDFLSGTMTFHNGETKNCLLKIPQGPTDTHIKFIDDNEEIATMESDSILHIAVRFPNQKLHVFEHAKTEVLKIKKQEIKLDENEKWFHLDYYTENINIYSSSNSYSVSKDGGLSMKSVSNYNTHSIRFYIKRINEVNVFRIVDIQDRSSSNKVFYKNLKYYLKSVPHIYKKVVENNLGWTDLYKIAEFYNANFEN